MRIDDARLRGRSEIRKALSRKPADAGGSFTDALGGAEERDAHAELGESLERIDGVDRKLRERPDLDTLDEYKKAVRGFLEVMVNRYLKVTRRTGRHGTRTKVYTMIEKVDGALEELERCMRESLDVDLAARLDEIRGILIDMYC